MSYPMDTVTKGGGLFYQGTGGEAVPVYSLVYMSADGRWYRADADLVATFPVLGLAVEPLSAGRLGRVLYKGIVQNMNWAWTIGGEIYASAFVGAMTQTAPAVAHQVAIAIATNVLFFDPKRESVGAASGCPILEGATAYVGFDSCKEPFTNYFLCDGVEDDVQIQEAVDYVDGLGGGSVLFEAGTYYVVPRRELVEYSAGFWASIELASSVCLFGEIGAIIQITDGTTDQLFVLYGNDVNYVTIKGLTFDLNVTANTNYKVGVFIRGTSIDIRILENNFLYPRTSAIWGDGAGVERGIISKNYVLCPGDAPASHGITLHNAFHRSVIEGNIIVSPTETQAGIFVDSVEQCDIYGNYIEKFFYGIQIYDVAHRNNIYGNQIYDFGNFGIDLYTVPNGKDPSDYNFVHGNYIYSIDDSAVGIRVNGTENVIIDNFIDVLTVGNSILDTGTNTKFKVKSFQFTEAIVGDIVVIPPTGIDVDATTEGALAWGQLPIDLQQVVRLKIWAVATDAPIGTPGQMHLEVFFNAGASNATYNEAGKSWTIANFDGEETDYVASDVVHWVIEDADVGTELANLVAGDSFEILAMWEVGDDPDGATDALFRVVEVEYV